VSVNQSSALWRLRTVRGAVPVKAIERRGSFGEQGAKVTEVFIIEADRLIDFLEAMFPSPRVVNGRLTYFQNGYPNGLPTCLARAVSYEGLTDGKPIDPFESDPYASLKTYERFLRVTVEYETRPENDLPPDPTNPKTYLEVNSRSEGQFLEDDFGHGAHMINFDNERIEIKSPKMKRLTIERRTFWTVRWRNVPYDFFDETLRTRFDDSMGKINNREMSLFHNPPIWTMLFLGYSYGQIYSWRTNLPAKPFIDVEMQFVERNFKWTTGSKTNQVTWQHLWDPFTSQYAEVRTKEGEKLYVETDLEPLFDSSET